MQKVVLITGCSTGIGRDLAQRLTQAGHCVAATARDIQALEDLPVSLKLELDVTQRQTVERAVSETLERFGQIDVLVNNAGYALPGALEEVPVEQVQRMFDVNVFGILRMVQAVLPHMRRRQSGRIINISSIAGKLSTPANGAYSASKFAVEALSDALRIELSPFGIQVIVVEPGAIRTQFMETLHRHGEEFLSTANSPYRPLYQRSDQFSTSMLHQACGPEVVSQVILEAIDASTPKARYHANISFSSELVMHLGDSVWDMALRRTFDLHPSHTN